MINPPRLEQQPRRDRPLQLSARKIKALYAKNIKEQVTYDILVTLKELQLVYKGDFSNRAIIRWSIKGYLREVYA